jgi:hypothetical protein
MVKRQNLWFTAAAFATLATVVSLVIIFRHLCSFTRPLLQRSIVRILLIIPIYSLSSFLSLRYCVIRLRVMPMVVGVVVPPSTWRHSSASLTH